MTSEHGVAGSGDARGGVIPGDGVRPFEIADHRCFACGSLNEHGMKLVLHVERGRAWTELALEPRFEGWAGIAHGGILCTILDEVMAWALVGEDNWGLTARLSVDFKRPVRTRSLIRAEGEVTSTRRRLVETEGRIVDTGGSVLATGRATYVAADPVRREELQARYGFRYLESTAPGAKR